MANELLPYFKDFLTTKHFAEIICLPHFHHHEKKLKKTLSGSSLVKMKDHQDNHIEVKKGFFKIDFIFNQFN